MAAASWPLPMLGDRLDPALHTVGEACDDVRFLLFHPSRKEWGIGVWSVEDCAIPGLKGETRGTLFLGEFAFLRAAGPPSRSPITPISRVGQECRCIPLVARSVLPCGNGSG